MNKFKNLLGIFAAATLLGCVGNKAADVPAINTDDLDLSVSPRDDFYQYVNGGWMARTPFKDEYAIYGKFLQLNESNDDRIKELFANLSTKKHKSGSVEQKIIDLYNMGLDSVRLNEQRIAPIMSDLELINNIDDLESLTKVLAMMHAEVGNPFFACGVDANLINSTENILYFNQVGLFMGSKDYYLDPINKDVKEKYQIYIQELSSLAGYSDTEAKRIAESVLNFETAMAEVSLSNVELRDLQAYINIMSIDDFKTKYDALDWELYAKGIGLKLPSKLNVSQPRFMAGLNNLIKTTDIQILKDYLSFTLLNNSASFLSDDMIDVKFEFYGKTLTGRQQQQPRWKRALSVADGILSEAVGQIYVKEYFPEESKNKMLELVDNLQKSLSIHIDQLEWMGDETKQKAQEKISTIKVKIGYPDKIKDYSSLEVDAKLSYWENMKRINKWATLDNISDLDKPVDTEKWLISPQTANAYYNPQSNEICFPAGILQPPFFNPTADDAVNYGAIGVVIGHELTHGFDDQGRHFDKDGNMTDWWQEEDVKAFNQRTQVLVDQFNKVEVIDGLFANGALTLGENIADQGGLRVAYSAMQEVNKGKEIGLIDGFTPEQRFYIAYATLWAEHIRDEEIKRKTNTNVHSLGRHRVNQTLKNIDAFYEAFDITSGDMYLAPEERITIW